MRQGNGSDLLGANDPRSATIGVIYVAQTDDRESVLAAILTQEKLGRKQIAIVLPGQNKAFQRPIDFEGLKNMRRKLQAQVIIVAPQGSSPAEFARQRRFTFFSSLESYGRSLRDESEASRSSKRSWLGGRRSPTPTSRPSADANGEARVAPPPLGGAQQNALPPHDEEPEYVGDQPEPPNNIVPLVAGMGAAGFIADQGAMHHPEDQATIEPLYANQHNNNYDDEDVEFAPPPSNYHAPQQEEVYIMPPSPLPIPIDNMGEDADFIDSTGPTGPIENDMPGENDDENAPVAAPIPMPIVMPVPEDEPAVTGGASPIPWRQSSDKRNVVLPYQAGNAGNVRRSRGTAAVVPPVIGYPGTGGGAGGTGGTSGSGRRRSRWQILLLALVGLLLLSLLLCGGIALAAPGTLGSALGSIQKFGSNVVSTGTPTATVTITPKSALLANTYVLTGIPTGTPDPSKRQVQARKLTFTTKAQSKTVSATGQKKTTGTRATGTISFYNSSTTVFYVAADNVFTDAQGIQIATDSLLAIPAGNPANGTYGHATASAHAVNIGSSGNLSAGDITNLQCCGDAAVGVTTTGAFTGGQDPQNYTVVQQSDIDNAVNPLKQPALQSAQTSLIALKRANEQFVNKPQCTNNVTSNANAGDKATSVTVTVTATCTTEVFDQVGAETIAANLLKGEADKDTGGNYSLSGNVLSSLTSVTADTQGNLTVLAKAQGVWVYQFDATAKTTLAKLIAGKAQNDATTLLLQQAGVSKVDGISISSGTTLPTDFNQITIVVQPVAGVQGTPTPLTTPGATTIPTTRPPAITVTVNGS